jgi:SAM-dependent methyltransferase
MASAAQGFISRLFRGSDAAVQPAKESARPVRHSSGLGEFTKRIAGQESLRFLDLGPTSPRNISQLTSQGHSIYNEDVLLCSFDPAYAVKAEDGAGSVDVPAFLSENLAHEKDRFDAILCWDICDYLPEAVVKPAVERMASVLKPGGILLAYFHTKDAGPDAPYYRYHIAGADKLELQRGPQFQLQRVFNNRHIENLFKEFASIKFFLARDNVREVLVVR